MTTESGVQEEIPIQADHTKYIMGSQCLNFFSSGYLSARAGSRLRAF